MLGGTAVPLVLRRVHAEEAVHSVVERIAPVGDVVCPLGVVVALLLPGVSPLADSFRHLAGCGLRDLSVCLHHLIGELASCLSGILVVLLDSLLCSLMAVVGLLREKRNHGNDREDRQEARGHCSAETKHCSLEPARCCCREREPLAECLHCDRASEHHRTESTSQHCESEENLHHRNYGTEDQEENLERRSNADDRSEDRSEHGEVRQRRAYGGENRDSSL